MWKKNEQQPAASAPHQASAPRRNQPATPTSIIGPSIFVKGDLRGQEDLVIQGKVEGEVKLKSNNVTVGREGRIRADIYGRSVHVEGEVKGHLFGEQEVVIRASGKVQGDIVSPRVVLENGSNFKGAIDMEPAAATSSPSGPEAKAGPKTETKTDPTTKPHQLQQAPLEAPKEAGAGSKPPKTAMPTKTPSAKP